MKTVTRAQLKEMVREGAKVEIEQPDDVRELKRINNSLVSLINKDNSTLMEKQLLLTQHLIGVVTESLTPQPKKLTINRNKHGLISTIDIG